ncbi:MAG: prepilin-type N-terminal cleavage/methylation domain-containing protein [bacterium]|nr:prepilin-type N-terminal cleavage/methylation domain-containing protein [bacterium]
MKKGMTLVELMVALLCMTVMMGVVYQLIVTTERIQIHTGVRAEAEYNIREAMDIMLCEIRHAGYRYYDSMSAGESVPPIFAETVNRVGTDSCKGSLTISADLDENGIVTCDEIISYRVDNHTLGRKTAEQINWEPVANNVEKIKFAYFNEKEEEIKPPLTTANADTIRRVDIAIDFAYPIKGEAKTLTTRLNTSVYFRNIYNFEE